MNRTLIIIELISNLPQCIAPPMPGHHHSSPNKYPYGNMNQIPIKAHRKNVQMQWISSKIKNYLFLSSIFSKVMKSWRTFFTFVNSK